MLFRSFDMLGIVSTNSLYEYMFVVPQLIVDVVPVVCVKLGLTVKAPILGVLFIVIVLIIDDKSMSATLQLIV